MIKGNNIITLCKAAMCEALQRYLNDNVLSAKHMVIVDNIIYDAATSSYDIQVKNIAPSKQADEKSTA